MASGLCSSMSAMPTRPRCPAWRAAASLLVSVLCLVATSCAASAAGTKRGAATLVVLACGDSPGQQGVGSPPQQLVNGVDGFIGDANPDDVASLPTLRLNGVRYLAWKTALAVAPAARPYRTVSVVSPASAMLDYSIGRHAAAPSRQVRMPVCGDRYTLFIGGIFVRKPACVSLSVTGPRSAAAEVTVPILTARC
jgi:hypothetical protein